MNEADVIALIERCAAQIGEHCNSVQILATISADTGTKGIKRGCGDFYARQGIAREFVEQDTAGMIGEEVARRMPPPDNDGESWKETA